MKYYDAQLDKDVEIETLQVDDSDDGYVRVDTVEDFEKMVKAQGFDSKEQFENDCGITAEELLGKFWLQMRYRVYIKEDEDIDNVREMTIPEFAHYLAEQFYELDSTRGMQGGEEQWNEHIKPEIDKKQMNREQELELWVHMQVEINDGPGWRLDEVKWLMEQLKVPTFVLKNTRTA